MTAAECVYTSTGSTLAQSGRLLMPWPRGCSFPVGGWLGAVSAIEVCKIDHHFVANRDFAGLRHPMRVRGATGLQFEFQGSRPSETLACGLCHRFQELHGTHRLAGDRKLSLGFAVGDVNIRPRLIGGTQMRLQHLIPCVRSIAVV